MSIEIPQDMTEVAMHQARAKVEGHELTEDEIITKSVLESLQVFTDEETEGHYDTVKWDGNNLIVNDIMGEKMGEVTPTGTTFVEDFRKDAMSLIFNLEHAAAKITHGR